MVSYKDLGLVNTREMFARAIKGGYAIPAVNFNNMEQMQAIIQAAVETKSPVILQVSKGARNYANATLLRYMAQGAVEYAKELGCPNPQIVLSHNLLDLNSKKDYSTLKFFKNDIFMRNYLFQTEGQYKGNTKRTHASGIWLNGYSDHLPVLVYLVKELK